MDEASSLGIKAVRITGGKLETEKHAFIGAHYDDGHVRIVRRAQGFYTMEPYGLSP